jgi:hypothetical protein
MCSTYILYSTFLFVHLFLFPIQTASGGTGEVSILSCLSIVDKDAYMQHWYYLFNSMIFGWQPSGCETPRLTRTIALTYIISGVMAVASTFITRQCRSLKKSRNQPNHMSGQNYGRFRHMEIHIFIFLWPCIMISISFLCPTWYTYVFILMLAFAGVTFFDLHILLYQMAALLLYNFVLMFL